MASHLLSQQQQQQQHLQQQQHSSALRQQLPPSSPSNQGGVMSVETVVPVGRGAIDDSMLPSMSAYGATAAAAGPGAGSIARKPMKLRIPQIPGGQVGEKRILFKKIHLCIFPRI